MFLEEQNTFPYLEQLAISTETYLIQSNIIFHVTLKTVNHATLFLYIAYICTLHQNTWLDKTFYNCLTLTLCLISKVEFFHVA